MTTAVLSVGSNLGDRMAHLQSTVDGLAPDVLAASGVYETEPWGPVPQPAFLNAVLIVSRAGRTAEEWWQAAQALEGAAGRTRTERWGPRTLDVDVLAVRHEGRDVISADPALTLPHPRAHERAFVLVPWLEVEPTAELAGHGPIEALLAALPSDERVGVRPTDLRLTVSSPW
jgi:2-amino-4-hydroxy-6-hydroxymethyldihydropteridine diphosphokinase